MIFLVLGKGKTGSLVTQVARERGHSVRVLDEKENSGAQALTGPTLAGVDCCIDFTTPDAAVDNMRAVLALGGRIVVGTTGWYEKLSEMKAAAMRRDGALLYGTNYSLGVQELFKMTASLAKLDGYDIAISETHHITKLDSPSGTALTLKQIVENERPGTHIPVTAHREGDASGLHVVTATSANDRIELRHEAFNRRGFAEGAVRAAEWLAGKNGVWEFRDIFEQL